MDKILRFDYEKEGDLLEIWFGPPRPSIGSTLDDGVTIFRDDEGKLVSVMILGASRLTGLGKHVMTLPIEVEATLAIDIPEPEEDPIGRLISENPELAAECARISREQRLAAVAEERGEYKAGNADNG